MIGVEVGGGKGGIEIGMKKVAEVEVGAEETRGRGGEGKRG